jgi:ribosomal protein L7/L12
LRMAGQRKGMLAKVVRGNRHVSNDQSLQAQLKDALARGDKDVAMALMRQGGITGLVQSLRAAQAAASVQTMQASTQSATQVPTAVKDALQHGNLIDAIRRLREANPGLSVKAAKDHVDGMVSARPTSQAQRSGTTFAMPRERIPTVVMGDQPGALRWLFLLLAFVALAAWWWSTT